MSCHVTHTHNTDTHGKVIRERMMVQFINGVHMSLNMFCYKNKCILKYWVSCVMYEGNVISARRLVEN